MAEQEDSPPPQHQKRQPGSESEMEPRPRVWAEGRHGSGKLANKVAIITGGDSGIGRAVAIAFAREGAKLVLAYLDEHEDAKETRRLVEREHASCHLVAGDVGDEAFCRRIVEEAIGRFGRLDLLVNNAGEQHVQKNLEEIDAGQLERTFRTNIFGYFFLTKAALPHLKEGAAIVNTTSVTAYRGNPQLIDYSASKGAIVSFTRSLSLALAKRKMRQRGRTRTNLDAAHSRHLQPRACQDFRQARADGARGPAGRSRSLFRLPCQRRQLLHERPGAASQRRRGDECVASGFIESRFISQLCPEGRRGAR
jgi:NAD(P)-dependent dehydrogenase (short-subunit alcohol dehydrogenase family)